MVKTQRAPTDEEWTALEFGWKVAKHVKSNAIVYARAGQTVGVGAGQMSRVDSVKIGAMKAVLPLAGTVVASDAFFPFPDGVEEAAKNGATAFIQPGGSVRDAEVIAAADRLGRRWCSPACGTSGTERHGRPRSRLRAARATAKNPLATENTDDNKRAIGVRRRLSAAHFIFSVSC